MTTLRQAAQQALEALEGWDNYGAWVWPESALEQSKQNTTDSIAALRTALEQTEQEPVACRFCYSEKGCWAWQCYDCGEIDDVQKPTTSAAERKPLTDEEIDQGWLRSNHALQTAGAWRDGVEWATKQLKEKNT